MEAKRYLANLSAAFAAGVVGAVILILIKTILYGMQGDYLLFKQAVYRLLVWGGIWALLLVIPLCKRRWFLRGSVLGVLVILFNFIVLMPITGGGFFASDLGWSVGLRNIILNYIWGVTAAGWYALIVFSTNNKEVV